MRYASDHKAETRSRVLREASRQIRAAGPEHISVAGIMKRAGLTHGGFYAHFASKDALVSEAIDTMFADALLLSGTAVSPNDARTALRRCIDLYLSPAHRDARERGCPLPALSGDVARASPVLRERFAIGIAMATERLTAILRALGQDRPDAQASTILAELVGAVVLARAVSRAASDAILQHARDALIARYGLEERE